MLSVEVRRQGEREKGRDKVQKERKWAKSEGMDEWI
jgi:hypothetical protein